jgi:hypothetical protein
MRLIVKVLAISAALASFPAMAADTAEDRRAFSQAYAGPDREEAGAEREQTKGSPCGCPCGAEGAAHDHSKS